MPFYTRVHCSAKAGNENVVNFHVVSSRSCSQISWDSVQMYRRTGVHAVSCVFCDNQPGVRDEEFVELTLVRWADLQISDRIYNLHAYLAA